MNLHRESKQTILVFIPILSLAIYFLYKNINPFTILFSLIALVFFGLILWFFRNPKRTANVGNNEVVAPVDGKVVVIKEVFEKEFLNTNCIQVSIFMSPLNVHVCRFPVSGKVIYTKYHKGKYLVAWHEKSSELNERTTVAVETNNGQKVLFRQIAGYVARRIVLYAKENDTALAGNEYGFIKFGSRVDVFLPLGTEILVKENEIILNGGEKIIAKLPS